MLRVRTGFMDDRVLMEAIDLMKVELNDFAVKRI